MEEKLRNALKEGQEKGKLGLLVWSNWTVWEDSAFGLKPGDKNYDFALSQIQKGEEATINSFWNGLSMPGFIAVSIQKLNSSDDFFNYVLTFCKENHYSGPITLVPITEANDLS